MRAWPCANQAEHGRIYWLPPSDRRCVRRPTSHHDVYRSHDLCNRWRRCSYQYPSSPDNLLYSLRVDQLAIVPVNSVPIDQFTLYALPRLSACTPASGYRHRHTTDTRPVLARAPRGMYTGELSANKGPEYAVTSITYCGTESCHALPPTAPQFDISFALAQSGSTSLPPLLSEGQRMPLIVAGHAVQAYYLAESMPLGARRLIYQDGSTGLACIVGV